MGQHYDSIPQNLIPWILRQKLFYVATAPLSGSGHVNVSPKSTPGTFTVVDATKVWYEDLTGSGSETIAHLKEPGNARITIMFVAFDGPPRIVRLYGIGKAYEYGSRMYNELVPASSRKPGSRSAIVVDIHKVGSSCGYSIPLFTFNAHRKTLHDYWVRKEDASPTSLKEYWLLKNQCSIDGIPSLTQAVEVDDVPCSIRTMPKDGYIGGATSAEKSHQGSLTKARANISDLRFAVGVVVGVFLGALCAHFMHGATAHLASALHL